MGGMIAQYLGAHFPDRIHSLLLCDTASEMPTLDMWNDRISSAQNGGIYSTTRWNITALVYCTISRKRQSGR